MRLTLRTLLAYRDRVLNANELDDMHGRVQQSAMASNLIKRLDSLSQRTNILAPPIEGKGLGGDANSIAEYLDDTLHGDKVPELERICLESDVQLAELAQCHSLLSAALSTPIEVADELRHRIHGLSDLSQRTAALQRRQQEARGVQETPVQPKTAHETQGPILTDKQGTRFRTDQPHPAAVVQADGQAPASKDRQRVHAQPVTAPMLASGGDSIRPSGLDLEGSHLAHEVPEYLRGRSRDGWFGPVAIGGLLCLLCLLVWQSIGSWSSVQDMFVAAPKNETETKAATPNTNSASVALTPAMPDKSNGNAVPEVDNTKNSPSTTPTNSVNAPISDVPNSDTVVDNPANDAKTSVAQVAQWLPVDANGTQAVVLVQAGGLPLHRLRPSESIPSGSQLFVPSANRPKLDIVGGPHWQVCGTTHALLIQPDSGNSVPQVDLRLGRGLVTGSASGDRLQLVSAAGTVQLVLTGKASAAVEMSYQPKAHGSVTNRAAYVPTLSIVGIEGETAIEVNKQSIALAANRRITLVNGQLSQPENSDAPLWSDSSFDRPVDILAASDLSKQLADDVSVGEVLQKLSTNRRPETRALAAQTLALLGSWEWVTQPKSSLSDARDRSFWASLLDRTRQILAAHPENLDALAASLRQLDAQSADWRLMLWLGLDAEQLQVDGGKRILASLESSELIERILAIQQLQRATGKDLGYQAGEPNRSAITQWSRELANGKTSLLPIPKS